MTPRTIITTLAAAYTLAGIGALIIGFVIPWDDPLAPVYALLLGAPWAFLLSAVGGYAGGFGRSQCGSARRGDRPQRGPAVVVGADASALRQCFAQAMKTEGVAGTRP